MIQAKLEITDIDIGYGDKVLIDGLTFNLESGSIVGLIGFNGTGKSTFLKVLLRQIKPLNGSIKINDKDIFSYSWKEYSKLISCLYQQLPISSFLSVFDLVKLGRNPYQAIHSWHLSQLDKDLIEKSLEMTGLSNLKNKKIDRLSGGELQRAYLALSIVQNSHFLCLDEPSNNLDLKHKAQLVSIIKNLAQNNTGIILVSHDLNLIKKLCDYVIIFNSSAKPSYVHGKTDDILSLQNLEALFNLEFKSLDEYFIR